MFLADFRNAVLLEVSPSALDLHLSRRHNAYMPEGKDAIGTTRVR
jgi:hypothetical protein